MNLMIRYSGGLSFGSGFLKLQLVEQFLPISTEMYYYSNVGHHRRLSLMHEFKTLGFFKIHLKVVEFN